MRLRLQVEVVVDLPENTHLQEFSEFSREVSASCDRRGWFGKVGIKHIHPYEEKCQDFETPE